MQTQEALALAEADLDNRRGNLGITSVYLQGIDNAEIIDTVHTRHAPMIPVSTSPRLWPSRAAPRR